MSVLPPPRNIRRNWKARPIDVGSAAAHITAHCPVPDRYGSPVEARAWEMARGWRKGMLKRVDVAYEGEKAFASVRFSDRKWTLRFGGSAAR